MTPRRQAILRELGLAPLWRLRDREPAPQYEAPPPIGLVEAAAATAHAAEERPAEARRSPGAGEVSLAPWDVLEREIRDCTACELHRQRRQAVPGVGDRRARWLMVGEGPGAEEDRRGEPFVGPAGQLLDEMLAAVGLSRQQGAFIANAVKCRPPGNRTPETTEIATCFPFLKQQVALLRPRLIIALGRPAAQSLLNREIRIADARACRHEFEGIPVVVTYHPAYLLRNPLDKAKAWEDLCYARRLCPPGAD